ncbi:MAG: thioredoxin-dependent thiol peroxidase [Candidatus Kapaibacterium sp.]|nr:thioredoxin-dependent thiol peroxidase [Ignavibacteriota bacterium]MCB9222286.1 thioredoxin-dependent thiol peroxidase [Ignavibacteria bacterium]
MAIEIGKKAPAFKAMASGDKEISLKDYEGKWLVLYFYPKDNTSGCTKQACGFSESIKQFEKLDAEILGVSPDSVKSHDNFKEKHNLQFDLLSDPEKEIAAKYDAYGEKSMYGRKYMGIIRSTYIIDPKGKIAAEYKKVKVSGHVEKVMKDLEELKSK